MSKNDNLTKGKITVDYSGQTIVWAKCSCKNMNFNMCLIERSKILKQSRQVVLLCQKCKAEIEIDQLFKKWRMSRNVGK